MDFTEEFRILGAATDSNMLESWPEYLCLCPGEQRRFRLAVGKYNILADANRFPFDEKRGVTVVPERIDGKAVLRVESGYVLGTEMFVGGLSYEFDDPSDDGLARLT